MYDLKKEVNEATSHANAKAKAGGLEAAGNRYVRLRQSLSRTGDRVWVAGMKP